MNVNDFEFNSVYDDGKLMHDIENADIIILGPSRVGKTPLCFYLGYFGIRAANIPLVPEVNYGESLKLLPRKKLIGLTRSSEAMMKTRATRESFLGIKSDYSSQERIFRELEYAENIYELLRCPIINLDDFAVEEAAEFIIKRIKK